MRNFSSWKTVEGRVQTAKGLTLLGAVFVRNFTLRLGTLEFKWDSIWVSSDPARPYLPGLFIFNLHDKHNKIANKLCIDVCLSTCRVGRFSRGPWKLASEKQRFSVLRKALECLILFYGSIRSLNFYSFLKKQSFVL